MKGTPHRRSVALEFLLGVQYAWIQVIAMNFEHYMWQMHERQSTLSLLWSANDNRFHANVSKCHFDETVKVGSDDYTDESLSH